jgi:hypothetical protein
MMNIISKLVSNRLLMLCFVASLFPMVSFSQTSSIVISNTTAIERQDELVVLKREDIQKKLPLVKFINATIDGRKLVVQHDDLNGDGKWDEAVFLYSFKPNEKAEVELTSINVEETKGAVQRAHVRLRKKSADDTFGSSIKEETMPLKNPATDFLRQALPPYLTEGPAWENDKVAFRLYFDVRNAKDIFGKKTSKMMMDTVGVNPKVIYHDLADWGMDILHVVKSLGAGGLALSVPQLNGNDTLMRVGGQNIKQTVYEQIADGPVRATFKITYDWEVAGKPVQIIEQTSIWGGQYFYESKVTVKGAPAGTKLVSGMGAFYHCLSQSYQENSANIILTHGRQSENKDYLGMAIVAPSATVAYTGATPNEASEILNTYISAQNIQSNKPCIFRYYVGWEKTDTRFAFLDYFRSMVSQEAMKLSVPVKIN